MTKLEIELEYNPANQQLLLIDYDPPNAITPQRLTFSGIDTTDKIWVALKAWIDLKARVQK